MTSSSLFLFLFDFFASFICWKVTMRAWSLNRTICTRTNTE
jgi:hypothetical protein